MVTGNTLVQALGQAGLASLARSHGIGGRQAFLRLLGYLLFAALLVGLACLGAALILSPEILSFVYRKEYAGYADVFVWLSVGAVLTYLSSVLGYALTAARLFSRAGSALRGQRGGCVWSPRWRGFLLLVSRARPFATIASWATAAAASAAVLLRSGRRPAVERLAEA